MLLLSLSKNDRRKGVFSVQLRRVVPIIDVAVLNDLTFRFEDISERLFKIEEELESLREILKNLID
jgi:hypothetical protein